MIKILVKPVLINTNESMIHLSHGKLLIESIEPTGESYLYKSVPKEIVLITVEYDDIKKGDYCVHTNGYLIKVNEIYEDSGELSFIPLSDDVYCNKVTYHSISGYKKVIAKHSELPEEYIQQFIDNYNNGIVRVIEIEMEDYLTEEFALKGSFRNYRAKLTNGFVTIINY